MTLKSTVFKADLQIADMDRGYYRDHALTIARHPSENDTRMMVRVLAFALHAHDALSFAEGIAASDEPDLWRRDLTGAVELWIDVGQPDEKLVRRACSRADRVVIYAFGRAVDAWWGRSGPSLSKFSNLTVHRVPQPAADALAGLVRRTMRLQCTVQDGQIWLGGPDASVEVVLDTWQVARTPAG